MNSTKKFLEDKFNSVSTRVTGTISDYDNKALAKLKKVVEGQFDKLKANSDGKFEYEFAKQQYVKFLTFKVTKGFIPTANLNNLQIMFPGLTVASFDHGINAQVVLVPKSLANSIDKYDDQLDGNIDSSSDDESIQRVRTKAAKPKPRWMLYAELVFWVLVVFIITLFFLKMFYGYVINQFGFLFNDLPTSTISNTSQ